MLDINDINAEIAKLEEANGLSCSVCEQLAWLYTIKDHLQKESAATAARQIGSESWCSPSVGAATRSSVQTAPVLTRELADEWASHMENADGTVGAHWTFEQAKQVQAQKNIPGDPVAFWIALNASYSDLYNVAKKYGVDNINFYSDYSVAFWLDDADAVSDKLAQYYTHVVRH
jgi:hypothetical protein